MQVRNKHTMEVFTLETVNETSVLDLISPSGETVQQEVVAGTHLLVNQDGARCACSGTQLSFDFEEVS